MPKQNYNITVPYSTKHLFDLVTDIESYPEFLPWIAASRILSNKKNTIIAELVVKYKFICSCYTSKVTLIPKKEIIVELVEGPFKYLKNHWKFHKNKNNTTIEFMLDFELKSSILDKLISDKIEVYSKEIMDAFIKRASLK